MESRREICFGVYTTGEKQEFAGERAMGHFGFSYVGLVFLLMLTIPNLIWTRHQPAGYDSGSENRVLLAFERVGQVSVS